MQRNTYQKVEDGAHAHTETIDRVAQVFGVAAVWRWYASRRIQEARQVDNGSLPPGVQSEGSTPSGPPSLERCDV